MTSPGETKAATPSIKSAPLVGYSVVIRTQVHFCPTFLRALGTVCDLFCGLGCFILPSFRLSVAFLTVACGGDYINFPYIP